MKTILIPIDGSEFSKRAMEKGKEIASMIDCNIILLSVVSYSFPYFPIESNEYAKAVYEYKSSMAEKAKEVTQVYLKEGKETFGTLSEKVETVILDGQPATKILEYLDEHDIDLVIMGSGGISNGEIHRILVGSVTNKVLHYAKQPILIIK